MKKRHEEARGLVDHRRAVEELLDGHARDGHHGQAAVLDLRELHVRVLAAQVRGVEAEVARDVARRRQALHIVEGLELEVRRREGDEQEEPVSPTSIAAMKKRKKSLILGKKGARDNSGWTSEDLHWQVFDWDSTDIARRKYTLREFSLNRPAPKTVKEEYNHRVVGTEVQIKHRAWLRHEISDALEVIGLVGIRWSPPTQLGSGEWLCNCFRLTNN